MQLNHIFEYYVDAKHADGRATRTIQDYHRCLSPFVEWCTTRNLTAGDLTRHHVRAYVAGYIRRQGWSESTEAIYVRNLRAFLSWIYQEGMTADDLAGAIECPRQHRRIERVLTEEELVDLLAACSGDRWAKRDRAIILLMADAGVRVGEMEDLRRDQVQRDDDGRAWLQSLQPKTASSGRAWRFTVLGQSAAGAMCRYLDARDDDDPALWIGQRGPLTAGGIRKMLARRAEQAGVDPERCHPHMFRKFFATEWIRNGGAERALMLAGGWSTKEALEPYIDLATLKDVKAAHRRWSPVDRVLLGK